jgi:sulfite reductase (NADPH) flavoprotein alpha-component
MLPAAKMKLVEALVDGADKEELIWLNGYLSGLLANGQEQPSAQQKNRAQKITIAYGTETGNSKKLAADFAAKARVKGITPKLVALDQYRLNDLPKEEYFLTIVSTQGEGEPPEAAKKFYDHIHKNGFRLDKLKYGVLALGDTAYPLFCKAGEDVDNQLNKLGAQRIVPLQKCDTDFEPVAGGWFEHVLEQLTASPSEAVPQVTVPAIAVEKKPAGKQIYTGTVISSVNLNDRGSNKETYHMEISADGIEYLPGDSLGLIPENPAELVTAILQLVGTDPEARFLYRNEERTAYDLLKKRLNIYYLPKRVVARYAKLVQQDIPATRIGLLDLLKIYPLQGAEGFGQLLEILEPNGPRLYSIASSPEAHSGEVHITVARDRFECSDGWHDGLCSGYLSTFTAEKQFEFYIQKNARFRLPEDNRDIIMIGPGTGIAPYRSFLSHREATGATGRNWLFFGEQHFLTDFLYQSEIQNWLETGVLTKVNVAFSRDQEEKIYVQHKMFRERKELFDWISKGAIVYLCGNKDPMSGDVESTLLEIFKDQGKMDEKAALDFLGQMKEEGRYLKDVY